MRAPGWHSEQADCPPAGGPGYKLPCWQWAALLKCPWAIKSLASPETLLCVVANIPKGKKKKKKKRKEKEGSLYRDKQGTTSSLLTLHLAAVILPLARCRAGDCSRRRWWRGGCRNGGQTYRWQTRCCGSRAWECSSQSRRNTAFPLGCTCIHTCNPNLRISINTITLSICYYACIFE